MKVGISVTSAYAVDDVRVGARYMVERARAARAAGLDSLFVGDHHNTPRPYYQNSPMLGRMLAEWGDRTSGALYLLPLWNPVLVAEQTGTLASIAQGRFVMQCALGGDARQSAGMGVDLKARRTMFEQSLATIRALWRGETVSLDGHWRLEEARISPVPPEPVDVWIGASAPVAIDRAARLGDGWLADPSLDDAGAARAITLYQEACDRHRRRPTAVAIRRDVYVGSSKAEAKRTMAPYVTRGYRGFAPEALVIGDVGEVAARFARLGELGYTDVIVRNITSDQKQALKTIDRLHRVIERVE